MILDQTTLLSDAQAITTTAVSTNVIDLLPMGKTAYGGGVIKRNTGSVTLTPFLCQVTENFATLTSLTVEFQIDDDPAFGSATVLSSKTVGVALLKAGYNILTQFPHSITKRYVRLNYVVTGSAATAGKITAGVVSAVDGRYKG